MRLFRLLPLVWLSLSISLLAQSNLSLSGSVKDQNGLTIPSATVLLRPTSGANPKTQDTDPAGNYRFSNLTPGRYTLEISKGGFQLFTKQLDLKTNATEDAALEILSQAQTMTVEATLGKTTGTRMDIPKDEIPISISTIPVQTIVEQGSNDLVSALRNASGVSAYLWYGVYEYYTIRGFNIQDVQLADGMRLQGNRLNTQINNIESVEILKGPASVNYGGGALAGAINLIRKKPQPTPLYDFNFTAGRFRNYRAGLGLTGSLFGSTKLQYRLDAQFADIEGWRQAGARRFNVTPALVWQPTSRDRITIHQAFNADRYDGDPGIPLAALDLPNAPLNRNFRTPSDFERFRDSLTQIQYNRTLGEQWEFRSAFQYRRSFDQYLVAEFLAENFSNRVKPNGDVARAFLYFKHHRFPLLSQSDVLGRFSTGPLKHYVLAGYEYEDFYNFTHRSARTGAVPIPDLNIFNPVERFTGVDRTFPLSRIDYFTNQVNAFYWQDHITITSKLKLLVGGRYDIFRRQAQNNPVVNNVEGVGTRFTRDQEAYTYRAGLVYELTGNQSVHFNAASAFTPNTQVPADGRQLEATTGRQFEIAHRMNFYQRRLNISTSLFDISRRQVVIARPNQIFEQAGEQRSRGFEFDVTGQMPRNVFVTANYGYVQGWFPNFASGRIDLSGRIPVFVPRHVANLWVTKNWTSSWSTSLGTRYQSGVFTDIFNAFRVGGYNIAGGSVTYRRAVAEYSLNVENLFNRQRYFTAGINDYQVYPGAPINVFGTVRLRFK